MKLGQFLVWSLGEVMPNTFVIAVVATKGGVGKTTTSANVAGLLADFGFRVLMVDADMQPSMSKYYGLLQAPTTGLADVLTRGGIVKATDFVPTAINGLDVSEEVV
jgi:chromosome partitioning related protein ParA